MATIGHLAAGFAVARLGGVGRSPADAAMIMAAAASPDVDFFLPIGHRGVTHSTGAAVVVGALTAALYRLVGRPRPVLVGTLATGAALTHVLLDLLTARAPIPALWPLSADEHALQAPPLPAAAPNASLLSAEGIVSALGELAWSSALVATALVASRVAAAFSGGRGSSREPARRRDG